MELDKEKLKNQLIEYGMEAFFKGLVWGNSGNLSSRLGKDKFMITGSGAFLDQLSDKDFVVVSLENEKYEGDASPSLETMMHSEVYKTREEVNTVFHSQPFFTTFVSCTEIEVDNKLFPESMAYLNRIERITYHHPGSAELAKTVSEKIKDCDALILNNHGAICVADSLENVLLKTETLEMLCRIIIFSRLGNVDLNFLSQEVKEDFLRHLDEVK